MVESLFESSETAKQYLSSLATEITLLPENIDKNDFIGMEVCHDLRVVFALEAIESAVETIDEDDLASSLLSARITYGYLGLLDNTLTLALSRQAVNEADEDAWEARIRSIVKVEQVRNIVSKRWNFDSANSQVDLLIGR